MLCEASSSLALTDDLMVLDGPTVEVSGSRMYPSRVLGISLKEVQLEQSLNHEATQIVEGTYWLK